MNRKTHRKTAAAALLAGGALAAGAAAAQESSVPVRVDREKAGGVGLTAIAPDAYQDILVDGELNMRIATMFSGEGLRVSIFESTAATTDHRTRPTDVDEFVYVLSGKLILTPPGGEAQEFLPGDSLVLPAGYLGTWEMQGNYREIAVTNRN